MDVSVPSLIELRQTDASLLRSGMRFVSLHQASEELLLNSIEADSTEIYVTVDWKSQSFLISDNGYGVRKDDFGKLGIIACCGKGLNSRTKWQNSGQTLQAIGQLGRLKITSRARGEHETHSKIIDCGKLVYCGLSLPERNQSGTSVQIERFLSCYPVRERQTSQQRISKALLQLRFLFLKILFPFPRISFSFCNQEDGSLILTLKQNRDSSLMLKYLFADFTDFLIQVEFVEQDRSISGRILNPRNISNFSSNFQYLYINNRSVACPQIRDFVTSWYLTICQYVHDQRIEQSFKPVYLLFLDTVVDEFDIILEAESKVVHLFHEKPILEALRRALLKSLDKYLPQSIHQKLRNEDLDRNFNSSLEPAGEEKMIAKKQCSLLAPALTSRKRRLVSIDDYEEMKNISEREHLEKSPKFRMKTQITMSPDSEMLCLSGPPFFKKICRSVHYNPPMSLKSSKPISSNSCLEQKNDLISSLILVPKHKSAHGTVPHWNTLFLHAELHNFMSYVDTNKTGGDTLGGARVIGCFDKKFILIRQKQNIIAIDQHAADERIKLENLITQVQDQLNNGFAQELQTSFFINLTLFEQDMFDFHQALLMSWGWKGQLDSSTGQLKLTHQPEILNTKLTSIDLKLYLHQLEDSNREKSIPLPVMRVLRSKACHKAVKFGDELTVDEQCLIINELSKTQFWFICAHGRPTAYILFQKEFTCPISMAIMEDPVILAETGISYERTTITAWFEQGKDTCPCTGVELQSKQIVPNRALKEAIESWNAQTNQEGNQNIEEFVEKTEIRTSVLMLLFCCFYRVKSSTLGAHGPRYTIRKKHASKEIASKLTNAIRTNDVKTLKQFYSENWSFDALDERGRGPIHEAAIMNSVSLVGLLGTFGVSIDLQDKQGCTALHWASRLGLLEIVKSLLKLSSQVNARNNLSMTPLHMAAYWGRGDVIKYLLREGANPQLLNSKQQRPVDVARDSPWECAKNVLPYFETSNPMSP